MTSRRLASALAVTGGALLAHERWVKPWQERWGATDDELVLALPGDGSSPIRRGR